MPQSEGHLMSSPVSQWPSHTQTPHCDGQVTHVSFLFSTQRGTMSHLHSLQSCGQFSQFSPAASSQLSSMMQTEGFASGGGPSAGGDASGVVAASMTTTGASGIVMGASSMVIGASVIVIGASAIVM